MTRDDIIRMAQEAGIVVTGEAVWRLCEIVAAAERNKIAKWIMARGYSTGHGDTVEDLLQEFNWQVREEERELCAQLCEEFKEDMGHGMPQKCAEAIRARGEK